MYSITVFYNPIESNHVDFQTPEGWSWVGRGKEISSGLSDWQITGEDMTAFNTILNKCEYFVLMGKIKKEFEIIVSRL